MDFLRRLFFFIVLLLVQVLVLNRIQLFNCATPLLYVYFTITLPAGYPRWAALLWSFAMGLGVDIFNNTPGVSAASMTLIGFIQPSLLQLFLPREAEENIKASATALGWGKFFTLATILVLIFCITHFALEAFNFFNWLYLLECIGGCTVITIIFILSLESLRK